MLQADGGTRTAAISGAYVALADAIARLPAQVPAPPGRYSGGAAPARYDPRFYDPRHALVDQLAAVSAGVVDGQIRLDLDYADDSHASVDMNVAYTAGDKLVEVQGSAENGAGFGRAVLDQLLDMAVRGCRQVMEAQRQAMTA